MAIKTSRGHFLGGNPSKPNPNELGFPSHLIVRAGDFPARAFVTGPIPPTKDQKDQGSCTAHGATTEGERLYRRWKGTSPIFSPAFHYYIERKIEGTLAEGDCGAGVDTSLVVAEHPGLPTSIPGGGLGFCPIELMPYNDADFSTAPSDAAIAAAAEYPGGSHHSIGNVIANIKSAILSDYTGVVGISIYDSFEDSGVESSGLVPYPNVEAEELQGGHETHALIGYDDAIVCPNAPHPGAVLCQNSWGPWGIAPPPEVGSNERGFYWLSYDFLMNPNLTSDVRMQHLGKSW
jgi:hypothetical protein